MPPVRLLLLSVAKALEVEALLRDMDKVGQLKKEAASRASAEASQMQPRSLQPNDPAVLDVLGRIAAPSQYRSPQAHQAFEALQAAVAGFRACCEAGALVPTASPTTGANHTATPLDLPEIPADDDNNAEDGNKSSKPRLGPY